MMTRRVLIGSAAGLLLANELVAAQAGASGPRVVFEHDVPDLTMKGWSATGVEVSYGPGQSSPRHRGEATAVWWGLRSGSSPRKTARPRVC